MGKSKNLSYIYLYKHSFQKLSENSLPKTKYKMFMMSRIQQNQKNNGSSAYLLQYTAYKLAIPSRPRISAEGAFPI